MLHPLTAGMLHVFAVLDPGQGLAPPGSAKATTIVKWMAWGTFGVCVLGVLLAAAKMAIAHQRGGGHGEHGASLAWVLMASVVAGSASALIGALS